MIKLSTECKRHIYACLYRYFSICALLGYFLKFFLVEAMGLWYIEPIAFCLVIIAIVLGLIALLVYISFQ